MREAKGNTRVTISGERGHIMDLRNERIAIIEIQQNLLELYESGEDLPYIIPDGIYGEETRFAIRRFQEIYLLPTTGVVDRDTWDALAEAASKAYIKRSAAAGIFPFGEWLNSGEVAFGERFDLVMIIQIMLARLSELDFEDTSIDGIYGEQTRTRISDFQRLCRLPESGNVDKTTWNALAAAYNNAVRGDPNI